MYTSAWPLFYFLNVFSVGGLSFLRFGGVHDPNGFLSSAARLRPSKILRQSRYWRYVYVSGIYGIMQASDSDHGPIHDRRPIHRFRRHRRSDREESEDVRNKDVSQSAHIEGHAPSSR
jgi:hypothetical protein